MSPKATTKTKPAPEELTPVREGGTDPGEELNEASKGRVLKPIKRPPEPRPILTFDIETESGPWQWRKWRWDRRPSGEWVKVKLPKDEQIRYRSITPYAVGFTYRENLSKPFRLAPTIGKEQTVLFRGKRGRPLMLEFLQYVLRPQFVNEWIWAHNLRGFDGRFVIDAMEDDWFTRRFRADLIETRAGVIAIDIVPLVYTDAHLKNLELEKQDASREEIEAIDEEIAFGREWRKEIDEYAELAQEKFDLKRRPKKLYWRFPDSLQLVKMSLGSRMTIPVLCERRGQKDPLPLRVAMSTRTVSTNTVGVEIRDMKKGAATVPVISRVFKDSRGEMAGLRVGDVLLAVNHQAVASATKATEAFTSGKWSPGFAATFGQGGGREVRWHFHDDPKTTHTFISDGDKGELDYVKGARDSRWSQYLANDLNVHRWAMEGLQAQANEQGGQLGITIASMAMWWFLAQHYHPGGEVPEEDVEPKRGPGRPPKNPPKQPKDLERERFDKFKVIGPGRYTKEIDNSALSFEDSDERKLDHYRSTLRLLAKQGRLNPRGGRLAPTAPSSRIKICPLCYQNVLLGVDHVWQLDEHRKDIAKWLKAPTAKPRPPARRDHLVRDCDDCLPLLAKGARPADGSEAGAQLAACKHCQGTGSWLARCEVCDATGAYLERKGREAGHHQWIHRNSEFEPYFRRVVAGGRTEPWRMSGGPLIYLDFNSLYPSIAATVPMPTGKAFEMHKGQGGTRAFARTAAIDAVNDHGDPVHVCEDCGQLSQADIFEICDRFANLVGFIHCDIEIPESIEIPPLGVKHEVNGVVKYIFPTGRLTGTWTTHELRLLEEAQGKDGQKGRIVHVHRAIWQETQIVFGDYVDACWKLRERGKAEKKPGLRELGKSYGNNNLGKWAMRRERTTTFMDPLLDPVELGEQLRDYRARLRFLADEKQLPSVLSPPPPPSQHIEVCSFCYELLAHGLTQESEEKNLARYRADLLSFLKSPIPPKPKKGRGRLGRFIQDCADCVPLLRGGACPDDKSEDGAKLAACRMCKGTGAWLGRCPTCAGEVAFPNLAPCLERPAGAGFYSKKTDAGNAQYIIPAINAVVCSVGRVRLWRTVNAAHKANGWAVYGDTDSGLIGGLTLDQLKAVLPEIERLDADGRLVRLPPIGEELGQLKHEHTIVEYKALRPKLYKFRCAADCPCGEGGEWHAAAKGYGRGFASKTKDSKRDAVEAINILDRQLKGQGSFVVVAETLLSHRAAFARKMYDEPVIIEQKRGLNGVYDKRHIVTAADLKDAELVARFGLTAKDIGVRTTPIRVDMWGKAEHLLDLLPTPPEDDEDAPEGSA